MVTRALCIQWGDCGGSPPNDNAVRAWCTNKVGRMQTCGMRTCVDAVLFMMSSIAYSLTLVHAVNRACCRSLLSSATSDCTLSFILFGGSLVRTYTCVIYTNVQHTLSIIASTLGYRSALTLIAVDSASDAFRMYLSVCTGGRMPHVPQDTVKRVSDLPETKRR